MSGLPSHIFAEYPAVTLVLVYEDQRTAFIENLCPQRRPICDVSPDGIMSALRSAASHSFEVDQGTAGWGQH